MNNPPQPPAFSGSDPQKPLENGVSGKFVLVTRPKRQSGSLCELFEAKGAKTCRHPVIKIGAAENQQDLREAIAQIGNFEWLVFVSRNSVRYALEAIEQEFGGFDRAPIGKVAAIGQTTADLFRALTGKTVDLVPATANSETLGVELAAIAESERAMIFRGNRGSAVLGQCLSRTQLEFREIVVYQSTDILAPQHEVQLLLRAGDIDWVTITSSAIARATVALFGEDLRRAKLVSLSPNVTQVLSELGFEVAAEAITPGMPELVAAVAAYEFKSC